MERRRFIALLAGGVACLLPRRASAQRSRTTRRVAVLMMYKNGDPAGQVRANIFRDGLANAGWVSGRNLEIEFHWGLGDAAWIRSAAEKLLERSPDLILANGGQTVRPVQSATRTVPVVFIGGSDPVAEGFVQSMAHPGGNITGFSVLVPTFGAKLLSLLREVAPQLTKVALLFNPANIGNRHMADTTTAAAQSVGVELVPLPARQPQEIRDGMTKLAATASSGLIVPSDPEINNHRELIVEEAARLRLPVIYALRGMVDAGGLMSYGVDIPDLFKKSALYADRILRGEKPADLPVQQPTKFEMVVNLKAARALGLNVPQSLLVSADDIIQ